MVAQEACYIRQELSPGKRDGEHCGFRRTAKPRESVGVVRVFINCSGGKANGFRSWQADRLS